MKYKISMLIFFALLISGCSNLDSYNFKMDKEKVYGDQQAYAYLLSVASSRSLFPSEKFNANAKINNTFRGYEERQLIPEFSKQIVLACFNKNSSPEEDGMCVRSSFDNIASSVKQKAATELNIKNDKELKEKNAAIKNKIYKLNIYMLCNGMSAVHQLSANAALMPQGINSDFAKMAKVKAHDIYLPASYISEIVKYYQSNKDEAPYVANMNYGYGMAFSDACPKQPDKYIPHYRYLLDNNLMQ